MSGAVPTYDGKDEKNLVSWLIPNDPPKHTEPVEETENSTKKELRETPKSGSLTNERITATFSDSVPNSPAEGRKGQLKGTKLSSDLPGDEPKNYGGKLWRMLFANVVRSVDELYVHCEEQNDKAKCQEVVDLLARSRSDFKKLSTRLEEQSKFEPGQAMAWEIRKPTLPSPLNPVSSSLVADDDLVSPQRLSPVNRSAPPDSPTVAATSSDGAAKAAPLQQVIPESAVPSATPMVTKTLNPSAKPFSPSATTLLVTPVVPVAKRAPLVTATVRSDSPPTILLPSASAAAVKEPLKTMEATPTPVPTAFAMPPVPTHASAAPVVVRQALAPPPPPPPPGLTSQRGRKDPVHTPSATRRASGSNGGSSATAPTTRDDWSDERLQIAVQQASEQVWAAAEAWVEAEAEAEEQEWQLLALGINSYLREAGALSDDDEVADFAHATRSPVPQSLAPHHSPKQFPGGMGLGLMPGDALHWEGSFIALSPEQRAIWEQTPPSRYGAGKTFGSSIFGSVGGGANASAGGASAAAPLLRNRTGSRSNLAAAAMAGAAAVAAASASGAAATAPSTAMVHTTPVTTRRNAPGGMLVNTNLSTSSSVSGGNSPENQRRRRPTATSERSPSQSPTDLMFASDRQVHTSTTTASGGRSLHDKLSSPDRKRAISPTEALRRYEERLNQAELNRDQTIAERVQKAHIASERVAAREQREAARKASVLQAIEIKQKNVEERRAQFLRSIQTRANNETSKVNEVNFINALNKEAIAQRLEEVETRILAAGARRQDSLDQRRRSARKVQQLSAWRLQFEKEKMERWDKLQQRLDVINARRAARLAELQRRAADEEARQLLLLSAVQPSIQLAGPDGAPGEVASGAAVFPSQVSGAQAIDAPKLISAPAKAVTGMGTDFTPGGLSKRVARSATPSSLRLSAALRPVAKAGAVTATEPKSAVAGGKGTAPATTKASGDTGVSEPTEANTKPARSKAREKKEKRKLRAQLIELAREADLAALQEAIAANNTAVGGESSAAPVKAATIAFPAMASEPGTGGGGGVSAAEKYVAARYRLQGCAPSAVVEGYAAWKAAASKKIAATAREEVAKHIAACLVPSSTTTAAPVNPDPVEASLEGSYTFLSVEPVLLERLAADATNPLLAQVVRDLFGAARKARGGEPDGTGLTLQVMQRLYVLLQHTPVPALDSATTSAADGTTATNAPDVSAVLLLRLMLGSEIGVLRDCSELHSFLEALTMLHHSRLQDPRCSGVHPVSLADLGIVSSMELEVRAEVWKLVLELLQQSTTSEASSALCVQCGLGTVLVDLVQALLLVIDAHRRSGPGTLPSAAAVVASVALSALNRVLGVDAAPPTSSGESLSPSLDALIWYSFTLGQVPLLAYELQSLLQHWQEMQSYHYLTDGPAKGESAKPTMAESMAPAVDFLLAAAEFLSAVAAFVRHSGAGTRVVVDTVFQLSPARHRHDKGRQLVSILRRADIANVLLGLSAVVTDLDYFQPVTSGSIETRANTKTAYVDHLSLLCGLSGALYSLSSADLSLAQGYSTAEQQAQFASSVARMIDTLQTALDGPHQQLLTAGHYEGGAVHLLLPCQQANDSEGTSVAVQSRSGALGKAVLEEALRAAFGTATLACLRNPALQKVCGASAVTAVSTSLLHSGSGSSAGPPGASKQSVSLLKRLYTLSPKYFKENRFRHHLLPCLVAMTLDCDGNLLQLYRAGKLPLLVKYLEQSVKTFDIYTQQLVKRRGDRSTTDAAAVVVTTEEASYVQRLSHLLPVELWAVALVACRGS